MSTKWEPLPNHSDGSPAPSAPSSPTQRERERHTLVDDQFHQSPTPTTPTFDAPLLPGERAPSRSLSSPNFVSSPLNPRSPSNPFNSNNNSLTARQRPQSRGSMTITRLASDDSQALGGSVSPFPSLAGRQRGSMVLYRLASEEDTGALLPPKINRDSVASSSGDSIFSLSSDSKYPSGVTYGGSRGLVPYAYDPAIDDKEPPDEEDLLHDPDGKGKANSTLAWRGFLNVGVLVVLIAGLLCLFIFYPVLTFIRNNARNLAIDGNIRINATGQAPVLFQMPELIDVATPDSAKTRTGFDGQEYDLVFSDEFEIENRTFYPGDDPYWEAVDLWYGATNDLEWYDPGQITTKNGKLSILMENVENHGLQYRSGMLQSWNKFCFTSGYIEVSMTLPGPNSETQGYWPGAWTMGNLGRPGYGGTTDGVWPYTYDSCDVGTFPNQTLKDDSGPAAALHSDASKAKYNFQLSVLSGQRLSACTCPGQDHPGPANNKGRGAPEIDVIEAERNKLGDGQVASQSAQFAPFTHDYLYGNTTADEWTIYNTANTRPNPYLGSAVQQAVSSLTQLPVDMFEGSGQQFHTLGFEYWTDPSNPTDGFITWQSDGQQTARLGATAVGPDQDATVGSGVGQRLIPEEPMSIILNLGISANWQTINLGTMQFPAEMLIEYVRVYQRKGETNIGCDPPNYPTANYIQSHLDTYSNPNLTAFNYQVPTNGLYEGGC